MADPSKLNSEDELFRTCLLEGEPALGDTITWAQQLNAILQRKATGDLADIIAAGNDTLLDKFAAGLRRGFAAIGASLELPWITSPVEGQISRLKMLKRTMYGRAGFDLLRARCFTRRGPMTARNSRENPTLTGNQQLDRRCCMSL
jgi:transposase